MEFKIYIQKLLGLKDEHISIYNLRERNDCLQNQKASSHAGSYMPIQDTTIITIFNLPNTYHTIYFLAWPAHSLLHIIHAVGRTKHGRQAGSNLTGLSSISLGTRPSFYIYICLLIPTYHHLLYILL